MIGEHLRPACFESMHIKTDNRQVRFKRRFNDQFSKCLSSVGCDILLYSSRKSAASPP